MCVCVCVCRRSRLQESRSIPARAYVACVHPVRTGFRKVQIDTLFALLVVVYCILIFRGWDFSFAQLMNRLARRPHLSEGEWEFFFSFQQSMRRLAMSCLIFRGWGFSSFAQSMRRDSRETRGMLNSTKCFLLTWTNHNHGRLQRKCRPRAEIQSIRHAVGSFKWLYKRLN